MARLFREHVSLFGEVQFTQASILAGELANSKCMCLAFAVFVALSIVMVLPHAIYKSLCMCKRKLMLLLSSTPQGDNPIQLGCLISSTLALLPR